MLAIANTPSINASTTRTSIAIANKGSMLPPIKLNCRPTRRPALFLHDFLPDRVEDGECEAEAHENEHPLRKRGQGPGRFADSGNVDQRVEYVGQSVANAGEQCRDGIQEDLDDLFCHLDSLLP